MDEDYLSEEEGFHEDALTNEEYDQLYDLLPQVKKALATYNDTIEDLAIKEALYYNYFELEPTLEELKSKFPKKKEEPKLSKLALLAKKRRETQAEAKEAPAVIPTQSTPAGGRGGLSKLAALAKARKADTARSSDLTFAESETQKPSTAKLVRKSNLAGLVAKNRLRSKETEKKESQSPEPPTLLKPQKAPEPKRSLDLALNAGDQGFLPNPEHSISVFLFSSEAIPERSCKRRRVELFCAYTNLSLTVKARSNFSSPSPDDVVLNAQKQAFETDMNKLSIQDKTNENVESKKDKKAPTQTKPFKSIDLAKELAANPNFTKPHKSFVIIGHVDAGKSTLVGRLLYDVGAVESKTMVKLVREAEKSGKGSFALAWIMDQTQEERSRGVTIDICATNFETPDTRYTAIDAPGHKDFVPQMISGVSQADAALLVVDSINGEFEAGFLMNGQTKEHTLLAKNLGIDEIIVVINKMDKENWDESRFLEIKHQLSEYLTSSEVGFKAENVSFIPLSGLTGYNVVKNDGSVKELSWYSGPTLLEALSKISGSPAQAASVDVLKQSDFNLAINDILDITSSEFKVKGRISSGLIQPGETVSFQPADEYLQVQNIYVDNKPVDVAVEGQIVSLKFKTSQFSNKSVEDISIGDLVSSLDSSVKSVKTCRATVNMFNITKPLLVGTPFVMFRSSASVAARITKVHKINGVKKKKMHLVSNQIADVDIEITGERPLPLAKFDENKALGRLVMRREGATVGAGIVIDT